MLKVWLEKAWPAFRLEVAFTVEDEVLVLFGPSGAGKSLTLQCIAGLQAPDRGRIVLNGRVLFERQDRHRPRALPIRRRRVGFVQQHYALFPHLTVAQNIGYGLPRGAERGATLSRLLAQMHLEGFEGRYPHELSGGQQQRVALARALAAEPEVLLLDEPFAALDAAVRERLQHDLRALQRAWRLPMVYVTHDLEDAFALGDRLAVIEDGRLAQVGSLDEVVRRPQTPQVARATGLNNLFHARVLAATPEALVLRWGDHALHAPPQARSVGESVAFYIRPEDVKLVYPDRPLAPTVKLNLVRARVLTPPHGGPLRALRVQPAGTETPLELRFSSHSYRSLALEAGAEVTVSLRQEAIFVFPARRAGKPGRARD